MVNTSFQEPVKINRAMLSAVNKHPARFAQRRRRASSGAVQDRRPDAPDKTGASDVQASPPCIGGATDSMSAERTQNATCQQPFQQLHP
jgi:hypothetical protein